MREVVKKSGAVRGWIAIGLLLGLSACAAPGDAQWQQAGYAQHAPYTGLIGPSNSIF